ncbi:hypothetical protein AB0877_24060, partial [Micromonospora sp. NPDC047644]|uniref:hypothetical protein n=1 Tax=Micromonospora sp. NPDC047644 TaxID=3157203 RepID=UPI003455FCDF
MTRRPPFDDPDHLGDIPGGVQHKSQPRHPYSSPHRRRPYAVWTKFKIRDNDVYERALGYIRE